VQHLANAINLRTCFVLIKGNILIKQRIITNSKVVSILLFSDRSVPALITVLLEILVILATRPNLNAKQEVNTTCAYCGVGCGIKAEVRPEQRRVTVQGDVSHPSSLGYLCSKGSSLGETLALEGRLLQPEIGGKVVNWQEALSEVSQRFQKIVAQHGPNAVAFYASGQLLTEDYYVANKLMKGFIGSGNIDTNSRLCMSSAVSAHKRAFGSDTVPACYEDLDHAQLIVLTGSNTAWCHPVLFQQIRKAKEHNASLKVVVIDPRYTPTCEIADLHLAIKSTTDVALFNGLLTYLAEHNALDTQFINEHTEGFDKALESAQKDVPSMLSVSQTCGVPLHDLKTFFDWFTHSEKTMTLYSQGVNQSSRGVDKVNAILNCHLATGRIGKPGAGPLSLTGQPNAMGGREVGGLANQLAAHMEFGNSTDRDKVARFWNAPNLAEKPGLCAVDLFNAVAKGEIKAIWIMATNPVVSLPNADYVKRALQQCEFVVVSDCVARNDTLDLAHVKLPALGWSEKDGTVTNSERRISRQRALLPAAGSAMPDWWIISRVAEHMGFAKQFNYQHPVEIFREHAALSAFENDKEHGLRDFDLSAFANISSEQYQTFEPVQWPVNATYPEGRQRFFDDGRFYTDNRRARFIALRRKPAQFLSDSQFPFILNTGRLRDQWHTMTRSALTPRLNLHRPEPFVEIHPKDAARYQLVGGNIANLRSAWGQMMARVKVSEAQRIGEVFVPMHWSEQFAKKSRVGALVNPVVDSLSGQPESKHTPVSVQRFSASWYGFILSREPLQNLGSDYLVRVKGHDYTRYEMAGHTLPDDWRHWITQKLRQSYEGAMQWQEYTNPNQGIYRCAVLLEGRLIAIMNIASNPGNSVLPERYWLASLFAKPELTEVDRLALLSGKPSTPDLNRGALVCACYSVGENTLITAISEHSLQNYQDIGRHCKAGTNCGSCVPEISALIRKVAKPPKQLT